MKRKLLSLLLSAVMLFTLVTPAFADGEETLSEEVVEAVVDELAEDEEVVEDAAILFDGDVIPEHNNDESFVATVNNCEAFLDALDDPSVTEIVVNGEVKFDFPENNEENFEINKPLIINGFLRFANTYVTATANVTVNESGKLELAGDRGHYTELAMNAPESYWTKNYDAQNPTLNGPKLINNGTIFMDGLSGIMLSYPCDYGKGENAELSGGEFKYADFLNYDGTDEEHSGLTACYTPNQATVTTTDTVLRTAYVNTEMGLKAALGDNVYNSSIQVFGKDEENYEVTLSKEETDPEVYTAPCTLMTNVPFTVGAGVTLNLAPGTFNQFNNGLTVAGTLNVKTNGNMCFVNGDTQIVPGGSLMNENGSTLCFNGNVTVEDKTAQGGEPGTLTNSFGNMQFFGQTQINGFFLNQGKAENCGNMTVNGHLRIEDDGQMIQYEHETVEANHHVLFNFGELTVNGLITVNGYLENIGSIKVEGGKLQVCATKFDNRAGGVLNGCVINYTTVEINGGTLELEDACTAGNDPEEEPARPYSGVFANKWGREESCLRVQNGGKVYANGYLINVCRLEVFGETSALSGSGRLENYGETNVNGGALDVIAGGDLYNYGDVNVEDGSFSQEGYVQNDNRIEVDGTYNVTPAMEDNTNNGECVGQNSVLCNNGELLINEGGKLDVRGGDGDAHFPAILHNNGFVGINGDGTLELYGTLRNFNKVENRGTFTVAEDGRIENHGQLRVDNSASYKDWGYAPITWETEDSKPTENNLSDDFQLRLAQVRWDDNGEWLEQRPDVYSIKGDEWHDMVVVGGQDYFGDWKKVKSVDVSVKNYDDEGNAKHIIVSQEREEEGIKVYKLRFEDWGETCVVLRQGEDDPYRYDGGVCLNDTGFYYDNNIVREDGELDEHRAQNAAVLGNCYCYAPDDELYIMKRDHGLDGDEQELRDKAEIRINGEDSEIREEDGCFVVFYHDRRLLELQLVDSPFRRRDVLVRFTEEATENFDFQFRYRDMDCYLRCLKPMVYVENVVGFKGQDVEVAVKAENLPELLGYQLQLKYDTNKLTATSVEVNGEYYSEHNINSANGTVRVIVAENASNQIDNGDLFRVTFTVANTEAVAACEDIAIKFDETYTQKAAVKGGESEKIRNISYCGGMIQTFIPGDVHRDGEVDILDAVRLLRALAEEFELSPGEREAGRLLEDKDDPDIFCVLAIMKYLAFDEPLAYLKTVQQ